LLQHVSQYEKVAGVFFANVARAVQETTGGVRDGDEQ